MLAEHKAAGVDDWFPIGKHVHFNLICPLGTVRCGPLTSRQCPCGKAGTVFLAGTRAGTKRSLSAAAAVQAEARSGPCRSLHPELLTSFLHCQSVSSPRHCRGAGGARNSRHETPSPAFLFISFLREWSSDSCGLPWNPSLLFPLRVP